MDLASVVAALASVGVRVSGSTPNNNVQGDSSRACPTGLAGPEPSGTNIDPGQHFQSVWRQNARRPKYQPEIPRMGIKVVKEVAKGGGKNGPPNPQRCSSAPVATLTRAATPAPAAGHSKKRPQGDNATPEGNNSKKWRLAWMARSLIAAGVDVKFPDEE